MISVKTVKAWSLAHKWSGLVCTAFLLMLCITGLPLVFHDEIDDLVDPGVSAVEMPADTPQAPLDRVIAGIRARFPDQYVQFIGWDHDHPNILNSAVAPVPAPLPSQFHRLKIDSRTAQILDETAPHMDVMQIILTIHREMFAGLPGELFLGVMGFLFVVAIVSGIFLYHPFMRRRAFAEVRHRSPARVRWLDLHNLLGVVTLVWALAVGLTGIMNTIDLPLFGIWRAEVMPDLLAPYQGKPALTNPGSVDRAVDIARKAMPGSDITSVFLPTAARFGSPRHYLVWTKGRTPITARLFTPVMIDAESGALVTARSLPWYLRALEVSRPLHFGNYGGRPLKILWVLLDAVTIIVLSSGLYLWIVKTRVSRTSLKRNMPQPMAEASPIRGS